jgi:transcriptional regulator with XRE-family HTH domain
MSIGARVRESRKALNWSQEDLARAADCVSMSISRMELDKGTPDLHLATRVAKALGKRLDWIVTGEGPEDREPAQPEPSTAA